MADETIPLLASVAEARATGATHYFTGKPCKNGHVSPRNTKTGRKYLTDPKKRSRRNALASKYRNTDENRKARRARREKRREELAGRPKPAGCEICGKETKKIAFDHCHVTGHFRGWICERCNLILGRANDDPTLLRKLADYLDCANARNPQADFMLLFDVERILRRT